MLGIGGFKKKFRESFLLFLKYLLFLQMIYPREINYPKIYVIYNL